MSGGHAQSDRFCGGSVAMRPYAGNRRWRQEAVTQSLPDDPLRKPIGQAIIVKLPRSGKHDKIIDRLVVRYFKAITAPINQKLGQYPGCSLVRVNEAMIVHHAVQKRRRLLGNPAMIA